jgi:hypothetical protein
MVAPRYFTDEVGLITMPLHLILRDEFDLSLCLDQNILTQSCLNVVVTYYPPTTGLQDANLVPVHIQHQLYIYLKQNA